LSVLQVNKELEESKLWCREKPRKRCRTTVSRLGHEKFRPGRKLLENVWRYCFHAWGTKLFAPGANKSKKKKIKKKLKIKNCASGVGFPPEAEKAADSFFTHEA
jgi:hypothetical protein